MEINFILHLGLAVFLLVVTRSSADTEVDVKANVISSSTSNFTGAKPGGSKAPNDTDVKKLDNGGNTIGKLSVLTKNDDSDEGKGELGDSSQLRDNNGENYVGDKSESVETSKEVLTISSRKDGFHGEECDPSNMCTDKEDQFVACLRVPGNDSPHLSLLIQNKGKFPLLVTISAPGFVRLEKNKVELLKNEDVEVKVSIRSGGSGNNSIILTAAKGRCRLDLRDLLSQNTGNDDSITISRYSFMNFPSKALIVIIFIVLALLLVPALVHFYRKSWGKEYQRLDTELPVSNNGSKPDKETGDDWNDDWGDDWGDGNDEETPKTPTLPVTPCVSSRGLASRRFSKEGWKD